MNISVLIIAGQLFAAPLPSSGPSDLSNTEAERTDTEPLPASPGEPATADETIIVTGRSGPPPEDPLEKLNAKTYGVVQSVDKAVTGPIARGYRKSVPSPVRSGLRNVLRNLEEPVVFLNFLLQLKPGKSAETLSRFAVNSTIGGAGLIDVAKRRPFKLPYRPNGFGYTLGYYGVKSGPYMYLPLIGPTTVRDLAGRLADISVLPVAVGKPFNQLAYVVPTTTLRLIDERVEAEDEMSERVEGDVDPYSTMRSEYLRSRQAAIDALHGKQRSQDEGEPPARAPD